MVQSDVEGLVLRRVDVTVYVPSLTPNSSLAEPFGRKLDTRSGVDAFVDADGFVTSCEQAVRSKPPAASMVKTVER